MRDKTDKKLIDVLSIKVLGIILVGLLSMKL